MKIIASDKIPTGFYDPQEFTDLPQVKKMLLEIKASGDEAVRKYGNRFDGLGEEAFEVSREDIKQAYQQVSPEFLEAVITASSQIKNFAEQQLSAFQDLEFTNEYGRFGHRISPIDRVGCYVPGGRYPLPSSALMTIIPAKVAGVQLVAVCSPKITAETIVASVEAGADRIFRIGGIQAIGAMAYGTNTVPAVDKIVGPGNKYVTAAKKEVYGRVGIDFMAGPSEVMVIADREANMEIIAADLLAQAEHDTAATAYAIVPTTVIAEKLRIEVMNQLSTLKTFDIASKAIENSWIIVEPDIVKIASISNRLAPEHLELHTSQNDKIIPLLTNYGSLFIGEASAEVFGDYCSGPNHTLPTNRTARYTGGLSVKDFIKIQTFQELNSETMSPLIETAEHLALAEGLDAHRIAAEKRRNL